jgi:hypothetical protein
MKSISEASGPPTTRLSSSLLSADAIVVIGHGGTRSFRKGYRGNRLTARRQYQAIADINFIRSTLQPAQARLANNTVIATLCVCGS